MASRWLAVAVVGTVGCGSPSGGDDDVSADAAPPPSVTAALAATTPAAVDPKLPGFAGWPIAFAVDAHGYGALTCRIDVAGQVVEAPVVDGACGTMWDPAGQGVGAVDASVTVLDGTTEVATAGAQLEVVRLGISEISINAEQPGQRVALMYGALGGERQGYWLLSLQRPVWRLGPDASEDAAAVSLELADGTPRPLPEPWADLLSPPLDDASPDGVEADTYSLPTAVVAGSRLVAKATLSADVAGAPGGGAPQVVEVRVAGSKAAFAHGAAAAQTTEPIAAVGRFDVELSWSFEARVPGGAWAPVPGALVTTHRVYGLAAVPVFDYDTTPHRPWVEVVDQVATWVDGTTADPVEVGRLIVEGVYWDLGLVYDTESGATAYTDYPEWGWGGAVFELSAFQAREMGNVINCSDAGSIVSTYANMVGLDFRYHILQRPGSTRFDLNYIKAIGTPVFDETPFDSGTGGFRYHAVVGPADGSFYDGTLALDGDEDPQAPPHVELLAAGMDPMAYLIALSSEWDLVDTLQDEQVRIR